MLSKSTTIPKIPVYLLLTLALVFCASEALAKKKKGKGKGKGKKANVEVSLDVEGDAEAKEKSDDEGGFKTDSPFAKDEDEPESSTETDAEFAPETGAEVEADAEAKTEKEAEPAPEIEESESEPSLDDESDAEPAPQGETGDKGRAGVNVNVGIYTLYNFRGLNTFQEDSQQDQNALFAPSLEWSVFNTGLYLGYWGAYQLTGDNKTEMVDVGLGHEQDIFLGYKLGLAEGLLELNFMLTYFFYPFADEVLAGTAFPSIIEPLIGLGVATVIDLGLKVSYYHALQSEIDVLRHIYINFTIGKEFAFNETFGMNLGTGFGAKIWIVDVDYNRFDLLFNWSIPIHFTEQLYIEPGVHLGWTDLVTVSSGEEDDLSTIGDESIRNAKAGDEFMIYGSVDIGADF
jgi:hypothetical protein